MLAECRIRPIIRNSKGTSMDNPGYLSPEWHDYVMAHFQPNELMEGNPTTAGLRRVAELLLGDIVSSKPIQVFPSEGNGPARATVVYEVRIAWKLEASVQGEYGHIRTYADVADVWHGNCDSLFVGYAVATASTRAEGRALRKALKIRGVAAEELTKQDVAKAVAIETEEKISNEQISFIDGKCKKLDINVVAYINSGDKQYRSIYDVTRETAAKMIKRLTEITNDKSLITETIMGYADWR